jgi:hypothetical protein
VALLLEVGVVMDSLQQLQGQLCRGDKVVLAAAFARGAKHCGSQEAPLRFSKGCCELGALAWKLQHRLGKTNGLFGCGAGHADDQIALL